MVKGKTKSGIKYTVNEKIKDDTRFIQYLVELDSSDPMTQSKAMFSLLELMFGGRDNVIAFQNVVAEMHDGVCSADALTEEITQILEALNTKNS